MRIIWKDIEVEWDPFRLEEFLKCFDRNFIRSYNWIFSDIDSYTFSLEDQESCNSVFDSGKFWLTGDDFLSHLEHLSTLIIFGLVIAVEKEVKIPTEDKIPNLVDNVEYWEDDYALLIPGQILEIAFFDSTDIIISTNKTKLIEKIKAVYPQFSEYTS